MGRSKRFAGGAVTLFLLLILPGVAHGSTIAVTTLGDEFGTPGGSGCSLREAVEAVNSNARFGGCKPKGSGRADTVVVRGGATYELEIPGDDDTNAQGDLDVERALILKRGGNNKATIDANGLDRVIEVAPGVSLTGSHLVLTGGLLTTSGESGAGILSEGRLELRRSVVASNTIAGPGGDGGGGGVASSGRTILNGVTIAGNVVSSLGYGGGFSAFEGNLSMRNSTVSGNLASDGGGLYFGGLKVSVRSSTISNNSATGESTGGGGILVSSGFSTFPNRLTNVTISGNSSNTRGGGIFVFSGDVRLNAATVTANTADVNADGAGTLGGSGGGLHGDISVENSLIVANSATNANASDCYLGSLTGSLSGIDTGCGSTGTADPKIGPLAANGGPTMTHALLAGSPAIGGAEDTAPPRDQRGRKRDKRPDIGAFER